jgi:hypothetical protein
MHFYSFWKLRRDILKGRFNINRRDKKKVSIKRQRQGKKYKKRNKNQHKQTQKLRMSNTDLIRKRKDDRLRKILCIVLCFPVIKKTMAGKKYSDFGGGKKKSDSEFLS